jgi:3-deoxy-manno-octulosonate cytidylyltransferase (CMP-KDO synthetase)
VSARFRVVIPSRLASQRLPGKPLLDVGGRPLVLRVWDVAMKSAAAGVVVATDDARIEACVREAGGDVVMTSADHATGTDRLAEVADLRGYADDDVIVNLQGDEPFVPPALLEALARALVAQPDTGIATVATRIHTTEELFEPSVVKTVLDAAGRALYFSRSPIPFVRGRFESLSRHAEPLPEGVRFLRHLGIYAYRVRTLRALRTAAMAEAEAAESLEQLRAMHLGIRIHVSVIDQAPMRGVDTPEDLARAAHAFGQITPL